MIREGSINEARLGMVQQAYSKLKNGKATVTIADLERGYDCSVNPEYVFGHKTQAQLVQEFLGVWESQHREGVVSLGEFIDYYRDVSPSIKSDKVFENMMRNTWHF
mmetsp:Transcript_18496/g.28399  ORF Transcript_18496/g.28399 Transcript_18496/m.28399 type:complete len:106 (-) Transcript_18496:27-344(-)